MNNANWFHTSGAVCAVVLLCLSAAQSRGTVAADPAKITFTAPQQSVTIKLTNNGAPIPAADIRGWRLLASGHDYKHMLTVEKTEGALRIAPSATIELGSYDLIIETAQGAAAVQVFVPLSDLPNIVEKTAALTGLSRREVEKKLGLLSPTGREEIQINLPPVYYEGQTLELTMEATPGRAYSWFMNGDLVAEGPERNVLAYTFTETGEYVLTYVETENVNGNTAIVAHTTAQTRVVEIPRVPVEAAVNAKIAFAPPPGYNKHVWRIDGKEASNDPVLEHAFQAPGAYTVECLASAPDAGPAQGFIRIRYYAAVAQ